MVSFISLFFVGGFSVAFLPVNLVLASPLSVDDWASQAKEMSRGLQSDPQKLKQDFLLIDAAATIAKNKNLALDSSQSLGFSYHATNGAVDDLSINHGYVNLTEDDKKALTEAYNAGIAPATTPSPATPASVDPPATTEGRPAETTGGGSPEVSGGTSGFILCGANGPAGCTFTDLLTLVKNVLDFIIMDIIAVLATIVIIYAGIMTIYEGYQGKEVTKYKQMLGNVILGMIFAFGSYAIVKSLLLMLIDPSSTFFTVVGKIFVK